MQDRPLLISSLIEHANTFHPRVEVVTRSIEGPIRRSTWGSVHRHSKQAAKALAALGIEPGDRVATLAWNTDRHLELYYGVSGMGAVLHTINPRLFPEQIEYIANHAEDKLLCFDLTFAPLVAKLAPALESVRGFVALTDRAHMPGIALPQPLYCYEDLLAAQDADYEWPSFDERTASSLCYTSGTTGHPKGVLYSHRSTVLHAFAVCSVDGIGCSAAESVLPIVPMFHVNAWGMPYSAAMSGAKLVLPGAGLDGKSLYELMKAEKVTLALGVPTVWLNLFKCIEEAGLDPRQDLVLRRLVIGGAAAPRAMSERFEREFGAFVIHGWGMTEMSPLGTVGNLLPAHRDHTLAQRLDVQEKQGRAIYGVELRIVDDEGRPLPHDGKARGHLTARGPWVVEHYFRAEGDIVLDHEGFFDTGDIATIDADGYVHIKDRAKDVIKSGGEWISSIDLENLAMGHPDIAEAAVIGVAHPKWQERPLLIAVKKQGCAVTREAILDFLAPKVAKWWLPDDVVFVDELPHTATGKLMKMKLREAFRDYRLPTA
jgi:fatty-acyl-CoA synthase